MMGRLVSVLGCALFLSACNDQTSQFDGNWSFVSKGCNTSSHLIAREGIIYLMVTPEGVPVMKFGSVETNNMVPVELIDRGYTVHYNYDGSNLVAKHFQTPGGSIVDANADPKQKGVFDMVRCKSQV